VTRTSLTLRHCCKVQVSPFPIQNLKYRFFAPACGIRRIVLKPTSFQRQTELTRASANSIPSASPCSAGVTHGGPAATAVPHGPNGCHRWWCRHRIRCGTHYRSCHDGTLQRRQRGCRSRCYNNTADCCPGCPCGTGCRRLLLGSQAILGMCSEPI